MINYNINEYFFFMEIPIYLCNIMKFYEPEMVNAI